MNTYIENEIESYCRVDIEISIQIIALSSSTIFLHFKSANTSENRFL